MAAADLTQELSAGERVGPYVLEGLLGSGAFGSVYRAREPASGRLVAVKLLHPGARADPDATSRFKREARLLAKLHHPSTVRVLDAGETGRGQLFIVFELLVGESLEQALTRGPLAYDEATRVVTALLGSLAEAHAAGIVHRDVKPANIFLCPGGAERVKLLDFGVAKVLAGASLRTPEGFVLGTPAYMAPEQLAAMEVGPAADVYAVGLVLAEMLTGRAVYSGGALQICVAKLQGAPALLPEPLPPGAIGRIIMRASAADPHARFSSAQPMLCALEELVQHENAATGANATPDTHRGGELGTDPCAMTQAAPTPAPLAPTIEAPRPARPVATRRVPHPLEPARLGGAVEPGLLPAPQGAPGAATRWRLLLVAALALAAVGLGALAALWFLRSSRERQVANGQPSAASSSGADRFDFPPARHRPSARDVSRCERVDATWPATLGPITTGWGAVHGSDEDPHDWNYYYPGVGARIRYLGPLLAATMQAVSERASTAGYSVFLGRKHVILVDARADQREQLRAAICD